MNPHWKQAKFVLNPEPPCPRCGGFGAHSTTTCEARIEAKKTLALRVLKLRSQW